MNDLLLPIDPPQIEFQVDRPLTPEDLANRGSTSRKTSLRRITDRHHAMARAIALGATTAEIAVIYNMSTVWVNGLKADPAFRELVAFYARADDLTMRTTVQRMASVANDAIDLIEERLENEETRDKVSIGQALEIAKTFADRTGNGPQSTSVQINVHAGLADRMAAARRRAQEAMIDITPTEADE
jgi:hypothetical protein